MLLAIVVSRFAISLEGIVSQVALAIDLSGGITVSVAWVIEAGCPVSTVEPLLCLLVDAVAAVDCCGVFGSRS